MKHFIELDHAGPRGTTRWHCLRLIVAGRLKDAGTKPMTDSQIPSRTDIVAYVAAMAAQLAQLAGDARYGRLAHLLKEAALEARSAAGPGAGAEIAQEPFRHDPRH